ncbi:MAG: nucleoside triphosphate pyrophosphohydrolase [Calditrichaeota bacterium]|nr:MAG: nucleoside triphosphate pyrophosphohydrolase [Calditrichota bacterium]
MTSGEKFEKLLRIMQQLRGENGCPWDKEQTHQSLRQYLLEETYEVLECLDDNNLKELPKELGDLLLQIVFHAQIGREEGSFSIDDVLDAIIQKLIDRHPHVFGDKVIKTAKEQEKHWERLKKNEGKKSVLDGVPRELSGLLRAYRLQQKAASVGFDWDQIEQVWEKLHEEIEELRHALQAGKIKNIEDEFGDLLFALVNISRFLNVNPEDALRGSIEKFIRRFRKIEAHFQKQHRELHQVSLEEMDAVWEQAKAEET